ncbi:MAG: hypothetical protein MI975_19120 [Cytophagales bacterium]|nr:hypothetical protein [Cytophagales bacterium]
MIHTKALIYILAIICHFAFVSCNKSDDPGNIEGEVKLYLIEEFEKSGGMFQIDEGTVVTKSTPLLNYGDLLSYNASTFTFEISEAGISKVKNLKHSVHGIAFAFKANQELIYTGYFWPSYSSMSCDWVTIDPTSIEHNGEGVVSLGYPGPHPGSRIPDKRNDARVIGIFKQDHKLIE